MSSVAKVNKGYRGSVSSKKYKEVWKSELRNNPDLFETVVIWIVDSKEEALRYEHELQLRLDVVRRCDFINLANAGGFGGIDTECVTLANKGKRIVQLKRSMDYVKINCKDFDEKLHVAPKHSDEAKKLISKNTSVSMASKVRDKSHWFLSEGFIKAGVDRRKGVPRTPEEKRAVSEGRLSAFSHQWEISAYREYPWKQICVFADWYEKHRVKHSKLFIKQARDFMCSLGIQDEVISKWLLRSLSSENDRVRFLEVCRKYKEQHED